MWLGWVISSIFRELEWGISDEFPAIVQRHIIRFPTHCLGYDLRRNKPKLIVYFFAYWVDGRYRSVIYMTTNFIDFAVTR